MHEHYDVDGVLTGTTVVTRESLWDDESRGRALTLAEYEESLCGDCGLPLAICRDEDQAFMVHQSQCFARRARDRVEAQEKKKHKQDETDFWAGRQFAVVPHDLEPKEDPGGH